MRRPSRASSRFSLLLLGTLLGLCGGPGTPRAAEPANPRAAEPANPRAAEPADPRAAEPANPPAAEPAGGCTWPEAPLQHGLVMEPGCVYRTPLVIDRSDVAVDCQGAAIDVGGRARDAVTIGVAGGVQRVSLRNCVIRGARRSAIRIGWRYPPRERESRLTPEQRYAQAPQDVLVENATILGNRGVGLYVESYAQRTRILGSRIEGAGGPAIYLDAYSRATLVADSVLRGNGRGAPGARPGSVSREGIAIDSSADNTIRNTLFEGNGSGGVQLYRNCGDAKDDPEEEFARTQAASGNTIEGNRFVGESVGVWLGSRQSRVVRGQRCSMAHYGQGRFVLDDAGGNTVRRNQFSGTRIGVLAEDDNQAIEDNRFADMREACVMAGTAPRSVLLRRPVSGIRVAGNACAHGGAGRGYVTAFGAEVSRFEDNTENGARATLQGAACTQKLFPFSVLAPDISC